MYPQKFTSTFFSPWFVLLFVFDLNRCGVLPAEETTGASMMAVVAEMLVAVEGARVRTSFSSWHTCTTTVWLTARSCTTSLVGLWTVRYFVVETFALTR